MITGSSPIREQQYLISKIFIKKLTNNIDESLVTFCNFLNINKF